MTRRVLTSDRNIPWLTAIPEHWGIVRAKALFESRKELARPGDQQLSATQAYGVIPQKDYEQRIGRKVTQVTLHLEKRRHAVSLGGDADTMACIAGAVAEPYFGIPGEIERQVLSYLDDDLRRVVDEFRSRYCADGSTRGRTP
jgi:hypothetical protein